MVKTLQCFDLLVIKCTRSSLSVEVEARCERSSHMCGLSGCLPAATQSKLWKSELSDKWTNGLEYGKKWTKDQALGCHLLQEDEKKKHKHVIS